MRFASRYVLNRQIQYYHLIVWLSLSLFCLLVGCELAVMLLSPKVDLLVGVGVGVEGSSYNLFL